MDRSDQQERSRCGWCGTDPLYVAYHDGDWGLPHHDARHLVEMLVLEGAQAGLSWLTILRKRAGYLRAFRNFEPVKVAAMTDAQLALILADPGVVRNRLKVFSARSNARAFLEVQREFGSFDAFLWSFVGGSPKVNHPRTLADVPAVTPEAEALSKALKKRGFTFVGPTIVYAFMQAVGLVDDHLATCWRKPA